MSSLNKVFILGRLGNDPEPKAMADGTAISSFSVATSTYSSKSGEKKEYTEWHRCSAFNKAAEVANQYLKKGSQVLVEGSLRTRKWEDNGVTKYMTEIIVGRLTLLGGKPEGEANGNRAESKPTIADLEDDFPF